MRALIATVLRCPASGQRLRLFVREARMAALPEAVSVDRYDEDGLAEVLGQPVVRALPQDEGTSSSRLMRLDVLQGALFTHDGRHLYPITKGIPRLLPPELGRHSHEIECYRRTLKLPAPRPAPSSEGLPDQWREVLQHNIDTYSLQWDEFDYSENTWGRSVQGRYDHMLEELDIAPEDSRCEGKRLVDAACGNATLALRSAQAGFEVFAFDHSSGVDRAAEFADRQETAHSGVVHLIQASLEAPPLQPGAFDYLYCGGAIHFTHDIGRTAACLANLMDPEDCRLYIWTTHWTPARRWLMNSTARLFGILPRRLQLSLAWVLVAPFRVLRWRARKWGRHAWPTIGLHESLVSCLDQTSHRIPRSIDSPAFQEIMARLDFDEVRAIKSGGGYGVLGLRRRGRGREGNR